MADTKISALPVVAPNAGQKLAVADASTSNAITVSSMASFPSANTADEGILFNNAGKVSSDAIFKYHYSTQVMQFAGTSSAIWMNAAVPQPTSSAVSTMALYSKSVSGRMMWKAVGPSGLEYPLQPSIYGNNVTLWTPSSSQQGNQIGGSAFMNGQVSGSACIPQSIYTNSHRMVYQANTSAVSNFSCGFAHSKLMWTRSSTAGLGGFFLFARVGIEKYTSSTRYIVGLSPRLMSGVATSNAKTDVNTLAFVIDDTNTSWGFYHSSTGTGTTETIPGQSSLDLATSASGLNAIGYDFYIYAPPNTTVVYYRMDEMNTGSTLINSSVTNHLPNVTSYARMVAMGGSANTSQIAAQIGLIRLYCESDT